MEAAKQAINKLTSQHGHHTTEVTEHYNPAVTHEQINPTREDEATTVVDREVHQDHHHTTVLPVQDKQVLPTEHSHNIAAAKHSEHHHGDHQGIRDRVAGEIAQFKDQTQTAPTETTRTNAPTVGSEHHHHHVHETIQPVVQKQTIQPSVVHTTVPVHEVHHNEPKHYSASALPAVSLGEFQSQGGSLTGIADRVERFEGEPENIAKQGHHGHHHGHHGHHGTNTGTTGTSTSDGLTGTGTGTGATSMTDTGRSGVSSTGLGDTSRSGVSSTGLGDTSRSGVSSTGLGDTSRSAQTGTTSTGTSGLNDTARTGTTGTTGVGSGNDMSRAQQAIDSRVDKPGHSSIGNTTGTGVGSTGTSNTTSQTATGSSKPSLLNKLNPFKDSDGDGKKGVGS